MDKVNRPKVEPPTVYLLSTLKGLVIHWDREYEPPSWAYISNELGEQVYFYAAHDILLGPVTSNAKSEGRP